MAESINFYLQWEEYFAAQEFFRRSRQRLSASLVVGVLLIILGTILYFLGHLVFFAADVLIAGLILIFAAPLLRRWASKNKWQREPFYHSEHEVAFGDEGVYFRMGQTESNLDWKYYQDWMESPEGFLLVYGNDSFNLLPKRAFANEDQINEFRALAEKKLKHGTWDDFRARPA